MLSGLYPTYAALADDRTQAVVTTVAARTGYREPIIVQRRTVTASYYAHYFHGRRMANGDPFNMHGYTVAHKYLPLGTKVRVSRNGRSVVATVTDRGPYVHGRELDLSLQIAKELDIIGPGFAPVLLEVFG
jgi:rare lipoprotein A